MATRRRGRPYKFAGTIDAQVPGSLGIEDFWSACEGASGRALGIDRRIAVHRGTAAGG